MKRTLALSFVLALLTPPLPAKEATPLLKDREVKKLSEHFASYFKARRDEDYAGMTKAFDNFTKKLVAEAKKKKVESLLVSPIDLRALFSAPIDPLKKGLKKGIIMERSVEVPMVAGQVLKIDYLLKLPKSYKHDVASPAILVLPPEFDRLDQIKKWFKRAYPAGLSETAMIIMPLNHERKADWQSDEGRQLAFFTLNDVYQHFHVDRLRLFAEGHPTTGAAVADLITALPSMFTGAVMRGLDSAPETALLGNASHVPFMLLSVGDDDAKKTVADFAENAQSQGGAATVVDATVAEDGFVDEAAMASVVEFVSQTTKVISPQSVAFSVPTLLHTNGYWFHVSHQDQEYDADKAFKVKAEVSSETNEFTVTTPANVRGFTIYLNDDLVDMGKPIKVIHTIEPEEGDPESKVVFEGTKSRSMEFALSSWFFVLSGNFGEVYTNSIEIEVPQ